MLRGTDPVAMITLSGFDPLGGPVVQSDIDDARGSQPTAAREDIHLALLHQAGETAVQTGTTMPFLRASAAAQSRVGADDDDAELGRMGHLGEDLGRLEPRLGRDAAAMEAGPTHQFTFHKGDAQPEVVGVQGGGVSAGTASDDGYVVHGDSMDRLNRRG